VVNELFTALDKDVGEAVLAVREADGHLFKVTESGRIMRCTRCDDILVLLDEYRSVFARRSDYVERLSALEELAKDAKKARAAKDPMAAALADKAADDAADLLRDVRISAGVERDVASASARVRAPAESVKPLSPAQVQEGMQSLGRERVRLGLPPAGSAADTSTVCRLDIGTQSFYSVNAHGEPINLVVNAQSATHAEGGAFQQAAGSASVGRETSAVLFVDRELCRACGDFGAVSSMAEQLGLLHLDVYTPSGYSTRFSFSTYGR
jgi:hypothetical protein